MCFKEALEKIRDFYSEDKKMFLTIILIALLGIILRLIFINATDISGDEVFFVTYAYKIAYLLWQAPIIALALAAATAAVVYLIGVKRNLWATLIVVAGMLGAKFLLGMPYLTHAPGPGYILAVASTIFVTNFYPTVAGELVSTISIVGIAFLGLWWGLKWNKATGITAFTLLMLSPYGIFMSTTSFVSPMGWFLAFFAMTIFFEAQKNPKLLPLAGIVAGAAFATRFPTMIILPVFFGVGLINRKTLLAKENRKNLAILVILILGVTLFFTPLILKQFSGAKNWYDNGGMDRWDPIEAHMSAPVAKTVSSETQPRYDNSFILKAMNYFYSPIFILALLLAIPITAMKAWKEKDARIAALLFVGLGLFLFFFSLITAPQRTNRCLGYEFPFIMLISIALFSGKSFTNVKRAIAIVLAVIFIVLSVQVVLNHDFKGLSGFVDKIEEDDIVFIAPGSIMVRYYKGIYLYDTRINKPFFDKVFPVNEEDRARFEELNSTVVTSTEGLERADYAIVADWFVDEEQKELLSSFKRCVSIKNDGLEMYSVFAKQTCP